MSFDKTCGLESKGITCAQHNHGYFFRFCNEVKKKKRKYLWTQREKTERKIEIKFSNWWIECICALFRYIYNPEPNAQNRGA